jgi:hypothetical protein
MVVIGFSEMTAAENQPAAKAVAESSSIKLVDDSDDDWALQQEQEQLQDEANQQEQQAIQQMIQSEQAAEQQNEAAQQQAQLAEQQAQIDAQIAGN